MKGKVLKVKQTNEKFGSRERKVNILGCFKYKVNQNIYIVYNDIDTKYSVVFFGSGHVKGNNSLCMKCHKPEEVEVIKEYVYKLVNNEEMNNFEFISLNEVDTLEIIGSTKLDLKPEVVATMVDLVIPKEIKEEKQSNIDTKTKGISPKKKKFSIKLVVLLISVIILMIGFYYIVPMFSKKESDKVIVCAKSYNHEVLNALVEETSKYYFNTDEVLESVEMEFIYQFEEDSYKNFILKGTYYKYMPEDSNTGSWSKDDQKYIFKTNITEVVDSNYKKPTSYEDVLSYYKKDGYSCVEKLIDKGDND